MMWLFSCATEHSDNNTIFDPHCGNMLYSEILMFMYGIGMEDKEVQKNVVYQIIVIMK